MRQNGVVGIALDQGMGLVGVVGTALGEVVGGTHWDNLYGRQHSGCFLEAGGL